MSYVAMINYMVISDETLGGTLPHCKMKVSMYKSKLFLLTTRDTANLQGILFVLIVTAWISVCIYYRSHLHV